MVDFRISIFYFPISALAHAPGAAEGRECETDHGDGIYDCKAQEPGGGAGVPLAPGGDAAVESEEGEDCAGGFVKELADGAPDHAQGDLGGVPESGVEARGHGTILVQNARRRGVGLAGAGFWPSAGKQMVLVEKHCRINALDGVASTG